MNITEFTDYVGYLQFRLPKYGPDRGARSRLARSLGCQTSFVAHVLNRRAHFSLEQSMRVAAFLGMSLDERDYFLLLVQKERAGTQDLKEYFTSLLAAKGRSLNSVKAHVERAQAPDEEIAATYYSSWIYVACHILCALPQYSHFSALQRQIKVPSKTLRQVIHFLENAGFITVNGNELKIAQGRIHIGSDSHHTIKHHINWRLQAIAQVEKQRAEDLHFTAFYGISETTSKRIKQLLLNSISETEKLVAPSKEEHPFVMLLDFFRFAPN